MFSFNYKELLGGQKIGLGFSITAYGGNSNFLANPILCCHSDQQFIGISLYFKTIINGILYIGLVYNVELFHTQSYK